LIVSRINITAMRQVSVNFIVTVKRLIMWFVIAVIWAAFLTWNRWFLIHFRPPQRRSSLQHRILWVVLLLVT